MKINKTPILVLLLVLVGIYFYLLNLEKKPIPLPQKSIEQVKIGNFVINVDVADDDQEREKGLSGRESISETEGMLFVFDIPREYSFWMKDMKFPIDIVWIDENQNIIYIEEGILPETYPLTFKPPRDSKYVLEIGSQISTKNNLKIGDKVEFLP